MTFKPKAVRPSSQELLATVGRVAAESGQLPTAPQAVSERAGTKEVVAPVRRAALPTVLVNFKATMPFAKLIAEASAKEGGVRRMIARMMRDAGYDVPEHDLKPAANRRTYE
jgi:hypothetical protein